MCACDLFSHAQCEELTLMWTGYAPVIKSFSPFMHNFDSGKQFKKEANKLLFYPDKCKIYIQDVWWEPWKKITH